MRRLLHTAVGSLCLLVACASLAFALQVGDQAPDFKAISTAGELVLSTTLQQGPVVLAFYFADFTPV